MILALADEEPDRVFATGANYLHKKIADVTTTHMEFPSGLHAHIFVSWLHPFKEQKLVVVGNEKMAVFDDTRPWEEKLIPAGSFPARPRPGKGRLRLISPMRPR
jgi:UDP-2-acetamido-3-amino-2,3-dideoxy-glucuronate N-acetyltransferase